MSAPFVLHVESGPDSGQQFPIPAAGATIGRQEDNAVVLTDGQLSRRHVRLDLRDGALVATDLGSANGTLVNGERLTAPRPLRPGDTLRIGATTLRVAGAATGDAPAKPASPLTTTVMVDSLPLAPTTPGRPAQSDQRVLYIGIAVAVALLLCVCVGTILTLIANS